jgi:sialic acid synthase SpsE
MAAGEKIAEADVALRRPGTGLPPRVLPLIVGLKLRHAVAAGHAFSMGDFSE